jgi:acetyltransferase-like isoleucine patch superfamily enzyme
MIYRLITIPDKIKYYIKTFLFTKITECGEKVSFGGSSRVLNIQKNKKMITIKNNSFIRGELLILSYGGEIKIGSYSFVGENSKIWSGESIIIGNNVLIAHNVNIIDFSHEANSLDRAEGFRNLVSKGHPKEKGKIPTKKIVIEDDVIIYAGTNIVMGVTIGKGSIVAAGSVVIKDVPPYSFVMGNPVKLVFKTK